MAVYKVIQDIESEDKLVGPLTLKGFVYAAVAAIMIFLCIRLGISGAPPIIKLFFVVVLLPPILLFGLLASPIGREQPSEVWLLSRVRFMLKPKTRIWNQGGIKNLVTITAPKITERVLIKQISAPQVSSRLQSLANMLDSRGWAIKNVNINLDSPDEIDDSQRLAGATAVTTDSVIDVNAADDILDSANNPAAQKMSELMQKAEDDRLFAIQDRLNAARTEQRFSPPNKKGVLGPAEQALLDREHAREQKISGPHPLTAGATGKPLNPRAQAAKLELANSGSDLSVASIAHLANRGGPQEISVELH